VTAAVLPRTVRFLCQHCGEWSSYLKTTVGPRRFVCDDCHHERIKMWRRYCYAQRTGTSNKNLTKGA
jgi:hypothetical protein